MGRGKIGYSVVWYDECKVCILKDREGNGCDILS
jgi:hypothetical protein